MAIIDSRQRERGFIRTRECYFCGCKFLTKEVYSIDTLDEIEKDKEPQICREKVYKEIFNKNREGILGTRWSREKKKNDE